MSTSSCPRSNVLFPYLAEHWIEHIQQSLFKGPTDTAYPPQAPTTARPGSAPGDRPGRLRPRPAARPGARRARRRVGDPQLRLRDRQHPPPRRGRGARQRRQRLADRRVARQGSRACAPRSSCPASSPSSPPARSTGSAATPASSRSSCRCAPSIPTARGSSAPSGRRSRASDLVAGIHFGGAPGNPPTPVRLALVLLRGVRRDGPGVRHPGHQHHHRGRLRPLPEPPGRADRGRLHLAAGAHVALRQGVAQPAPPRPLGQARAVGVHPRARARHDPAARRAAGAAAPAAR